MTDRRRMGAGCRALRTLHIISAAFAVCFLLAPAIAAAEDQPSAAELTACAAEHNESAEAVIAACTALIEPGQLDAKELSRVYTYRALGYERKDEFDRAIADASQAIILDATNAVAFHRRGDLYKILRQDDLALADFNEAIRLDPKTPLYFINRSNVYLDMHRYDLALRDIDEALQLDPKDEREAIVNRCTVLTFRGEFAAAMADCQKGLQQWPGDPYPLSQVAFLYFKMNKFDDSIAAYDKVLAVPDLGADDPYEKAYPLYGRGLAKMKKGDKAGGEADMAAAVALRKDIARDFE